MKRFLTKWCMFFGCMFVAVAVYVTRVDVDVTGDFGMLGRIPFGTHYDREVGTLAFHKDIQSVLVDVDSAAQYPVLLFGDSFTEPNHALGHGMAELLGDTTHVVCTGVMANFEPIQTYWFALKTGRLRKGQTVILESAARLLMERLLTFAPEDTAKPDLRTTEHWRRTQQMVLEELRQRGESGRAEHAFQLNEMLTWIRLRLGYKQTVQHAVLDRPMFSHAEYASDLFFHMNDRKNAGLTDDYLQGMAASLNAIFAESERQGVNLYFLLVPDKYDLYWRYIENPPTAEPNMLHFVQYVDSRYKSRVIDVKPFLVSEIEGGEKDVYLVNDSHWSVATGRKIGRMVGERLLRDSVYVSDVKKLI